jgi:hypothetical protein
LELKAAIRDFIDYAAMGGIVPTAAGRAMSAQEINDLIAAYEKHVIHTTSEYIVVTEKPVYHIIESKDY